MNKQKGAAFFDFDGTITTRDSFVEFVRFTKGNTRLVICLVLNLHYILLYLLRFYPKKRLKERIFSYLFSDTPVEVLEEEGKLFCEKRLPQIINPTAMSRLQWHQEQGHEIFIVTASSGTWLQAWCSEIGCTLIATEYEQKNNRFTGKIVGQNCHGREKAERIKTLIGSYSVSYGYGNSRSDRYFLNLTNHPVRTGFKDNNNEGNLINSLVFITILIISLGLRFFHFRDLIDDPHGWRQCDTANYIRSFYQNGVDFLHPSVCWMGGYQTLILEFPLPEALVAWLAHLFGPGNILARCIFLFFFCGGVFYFYKICNLLLDKQVARLATIIYTLLPLSYYYSRAIHIDYFALSFAFAMFYYYFKGIRQQSIIMIVAGSVFATIAFLVKAPYAVCFSLPLLYIIIKEKKWIFCLKMSFIFVIPVLIFGWWVKESNYINSLAPDWHFIPGYRRFDDNVKWYFGSLEHRFILRSWNTLSGRFLHDLTAGIPGMILLLTGLLSSAFRKRYIIVYLWLAGVVLYLLIFFNLNVLHNYYQIPFVPIFAVFMALGINTLSSLFRKASFQKVIMVVLTAVLIASSIHFSESEYFTYEKEHHLVAEKIKENTQPNDLVIVSYGGLSVHCPNILYRAERNGWSIPSDILTPEITYKLMQEGCRHVAWVGGQMPDTRMGDYMRYFQFRSIPVDEDSQLFLVNLRITSTGKPFSVCDANE